MSPELGEMLKRIPVQVRENVKSDIIYLGEGVAQGMERERMEVEVRVFLLEGKKMASVRARNAAGLRLVKQNFTPWTLDVDNAQQGRCFSLQIGIELADLADERLSTSCR